MMSAATLHAYTRHGFRLTRLDKKAATALAQYFLGGSPSFGAAYLDGLEWAIFQGTDTFVWGVKTADGWRWATDRAETDKVAPPHAKRLLELRAFGAQAELLLWRTPKGLTGRIAEDVPAPRDFAPLMRRARFLPDLPGEAGQIVETADPLFVRRVCGDGRITVTPHGAGVEMREYLESCNDTGILRVALTRFVSIYREETQEQ